MWFHAVSWWFVVMFFLLQILHLICASLLAMTLADASGNFLLSFLGFICILLEEFGWFWLKFLL